MYGHGVAIDYERALAAYKIGAEGGDAICENQLGYMLQHGRGIDVDYEQALVWYEKAAAQDHPSANANLGIMALRGLGQTPSCRRARKHIQRAIDLGSPDAPGNMQRLTGSIQKVRALTPNTCLELPPSPPPLHPPSSLPSWTRGSRSTAPPATP